MFAFIYTYIYVYTCLPFLLVARRRVTYSTRCTEMKKFSRYSRCINPTAASRLTPVNVNSTCNYKRVYILYTYEHKEHMEILKCNVQTMLCMRVYVYAYIHVYRYIQQIYNIYIYTYIRIQYYSFIRILVMYRVHS